MYIYRNNEDRIQAFLASQRAAFKQSNPEWAKQWAVGPSGANQKPMEESKPKDENTPVRYIIN